jgi:hypothetical protein
MKITALKTGRFAHPVVSEPQIELVEGKEYDVDTQIGTALIDCKWAEEASEAVSKELPGSTQVIEKPIKSAIKKTVKRKVKKGKK